jgi:NitT/TauT family transport system permease protein
VECVLVSDVAIGSNAAPVLYRVRLVAIQQIPPPGPVDSTGRRRKSSARFMPRLVLAGLSIVVGVLIYEVIRLTAGTPLLPASGAVGRALIEVARARDTYMHLGASVRRVLEGYLLSVFLALPLSVAIVRSKVVRTLFQGQHEFIRYIPVPAFAPLCLALFGVGDLTKVSLLFIGTYFQLLFLFIADFRGVPEEILQTAQTMGLRRWGLVMRVALPESAPRILDSMRVAFGWAWSYLLVAEVINARKGIGYMVMQSYRVLKMDQLLALLIVIGVFGLVTDALFRWIERQACPWAYLPAPEFQ